MNVSRQLCFENKPLEFPLAIGNDTHCSSSEVMIATGERKRDTIRAVIPESEHATIALASISIAIPQVECDTASVMLRIWKSAS